ncbi:hypothetical protein CHUAL_003577 [Chamberlinius hualienensis]
MAKAQWKKKFLETGMAPITTLLKYFGLTLDSDIEIPNPFKKKPQEVSQAHSKRSFYNWTIICLNSMMLPLTLILNYNYFIALYGAQTTDKIPVLTSMAIGTAKYLSCFVYYISFCFQTKTICYFLRQLANHVLVIQKERDDVNISKSVKKIAYVCIGFYATFTMLDASIVIGDAAIKWNLITNRDLIFYIGQLTQLIFSLTTSSFSHMCTAFSIFVCKTVAVVIENNILEIATDECDSPTQTISQHLVAHQKMSVLVKQTDCVLSKYMLVTMIIELVTAILYGKAIYAQTYNFLASVVVFVFTTTVYSMFFVKAVISSNVNDKLKSSLTLRNIPNSIQDLEHCSAEHVNYILYLNEQQINKAELTYGGFFPVRKTFIFTIAGTALTYALVLNGIPSP